MVRTLSTTCPDEKLDFCYRLTVENVRLVPMMLRAVISTLFVILIWTVILMMVAVVLMIVAVIIVINVLHIFSVTLIDLHFYFTDSVRQQMVSHTRFP